MRSKHILTEPTLTKFAPNLHFGSTHNVLGPLHNPILGIPTPSNNYVIYNKTFTAFFPTLFKVDLGEPIFYEVPYMYYNDNKKLNEKPLLQHLNTVTTIADVHKFSYFLVPRLGLKSMQHWPPKS